MEPKKWRYPAQPERYEKSPGMRDYENMLGHYDLNFSDFDAYLAHTQCAVGSGKGGNPPPRIDDLGPDWKSEVGGQKSEVGGQQSEDVAPAGGAGEGKPAETPGGIDPAPPEDIALGDASLTPDSSLNADPRTLNPKKATKRQMLERLAAIRLWLQEGVMPAQIVTYAQQLWGIKRRMCQIYLKRVREGWAKQASKVDYLAHLWHSITPPRRRVRRIDPAAFLHLPFAPFLLFLHPLLVPFVPPSVAHMFEPFEELIPRHHHHPLPMRLGLGAIRTFVALSRDPMFQDRGHHIIAIFEQGGEAAQRSREAAQVGGLI